MIPTFNEVLTECAQAVKYVANFDKLYDTNLSALLLEGRLLPTIEEGNATGIVKFEVDMFVDHVIYFTYHPIAMEILTKQKR